VAEILEKIGLTGGLLAALVLVGAMFMGERRRRRAAEARAEVSRQNAESSEKVKEEVVRANSVRDKEVEKVDAWEKSALAEVGVKGDEVDEAAAKGGSSLASMWNKIMGRNRKEK
jgi:hypothetical protein